jgi:hypothetical protein
MQMSPSSTVQALTCLLQRISSPPCSYRRMEEVYINGHPHPLVPEEDGRLDLSPLKLDPASIVIHGYAGLVRSDGITKRTWASLRRGLPQSSESEPLGTAVNPLQVEGTAGGRECNIMALLSKCICISPTFQSPC